MSPPDPTAISAAKAAWSAADAAWSARNAAWWALGAAIFAGLLNGAALFGVYRFSTADARRERRGRLRGFASSLSHSLEIMETLYDFMAGKPDAATLDLHLIEDSAWSALQTLGAIPRDIDDPELIRQLNNAETLARLIVRRVGRMKDVAGGASLGEWRAFLVSLGATPEKMLNALHARARDLKVD